MIDKDPLAYSILTYIWVVGLSAWGGVVGYLRNVKNGVTHRFSLAELLGEITTSGFSGVLTFWLCEAANFNGLLTAALVGISGHMGSRALRGLEGVFQKHFPANAGRDAGTDT